MGAPSKGNQYQSGTLGEARFYEVCMDGMEKALQRGGNGMHWLHVFSRNETLDALQADQAQAQADYPNAKEAIERMERLAGKIERSKVVHVVPVSGRVPPAIVADSRFQVATVFERSRYYMWFTGPEAGAERLWKILKSLEKSESLVNFVAEAKSKIAH